MPSLCNLLQITLNLIHAGRGDVSISREKLAHIAFNRFGLGAKPGGVRRISADPKAALIAELDAPDIALITATGLPTYKQACNAMHRDFEREEAMRQLEFDARIAKHMEPEIGFVERLVLFFSNHFSMSVNKDGAIRATIGQLERDVIRKNVLGSFLWMLIGVMKHPAMLAYLDNADSIGPNSVIGQSWGVGLNQNLAREILELHTLGVNGGYTESDVDALSKIITGWSFVRGWEADGGYNGGTGPTRGMFLYRPKWHEPGRQTVLGQQFPNTGMDQGIEVFRFLARHRSTAQFIAYKLVKHFITDEPTPAMVDPVAAAFRSSGGNLRTVALALINLPEAWALPLTKVRTPYELQVAEMRALQRRYRAKETWAFNETLRSLNNTPWERPTPDGFPDENSYWLSPDSMRIRAETAQLSAWALLQSGPYPTTPAMLADSLFRSALTDASRAAVADPGDPANGLTMLFTIPEFQRR